MKPTPERKEQLKDVDKKISDTVGEPESYYT
jgi:hypothetical protein